MTRRQLELEEREAAFQRWRALRQADLQQGLEAVVSQDARFRGVQEPALKAVVRGESPVLVVMGTGGGKSLVFMLPAWLSTGLTVVIVPLISLRQDLQRRCDGIGLKCVEWRGSDVLSNSVEHTARLLLVTPEAAATDLQHGRCR